jgi:hypothetical protein
VVDPQWAPDEVRLIAFIERHGYTTLDVALLRMLARHGCPRGMAAVLMLSAKMNPRGPSFWSLAGAAVQKAKREGWPR